jgi:putative ABC transport system permease protein
VPLSGEQYVVVGIAAAGYEPNPPAEIWLPLQADPNSTNQGNYLLCAGRLKPGVTLERANAVMKGAAEQFRRLYPDTMSKEETAEAVPLREFLVGEIRPLLLITFGAVGFVLLIACANVASLLLARAAGREKELAIRTAVGAGRARLIRQLLTESGLLAVSGGALGVLLGYWGLKLLLAFAPAELPRVSEFAAHPALDGTVLAFTLGLSVLTGVLFGLGPALRISRPDVSAALREGSGRTSASAGHLRARGLLIVAEIALGVVLLTGAGLLIRTAMSMRSVAPGFDTARVLTFRTALSGSRYGKTAAVAQFSRLVAERLESVPGVQAAAAAVSLPTMLGPDMPFEIEGAKEGSGGDEFWRFVSPHFFKAMQIPLLRGRVFTETDARSAPAVVIINEAMARKYWAKKDPVGQRITIAKGVGPELADPTREIVGVVGSVREGGLDKDAPPVMYVPQAQVSDGITALINQAIPIAWVLRTAGDPQAAAAAVRREVTAVDPQQAVFEFRTMEQVLGQSMGTRSFLLVLLTAFAAVALLLAAIGIYGVMSYAVEQRTNEIGIRMALGAGRAQVLGMVLRQGILLTAAGVAAGLAGAFGATRVLSAILYGIKATDPATFAAVALVLGVVALLAILMPAHRATRVDPVVALRWQ